MPLTNVQKQRRFRAKLKATGRYEEYKQKHREEVRKSRAARKAAETNLPRAVRERVEKERRESERKRVAEWRKHNKEKKEQASTQEQEKRSPFRSAQAYAKATARVRRILPQTPNRRKAICRNLYDTECDASTPMSPKEKPNKRYDSLLLNQETVDLVQNFFERDDISRQAPGKIDVITVREGKGKKKKIQARHLTSSILETHALFCKEYPDVKVGESKFAELRPKHVQLSSKLPHNVCLCRYHENFIMAINALHKASPSCPSYSHELPEGFLCSKPERACWMNDCNSCKDVAGFRRIMNYDTADAQWYVWKTADDNRLMKVVEEGTTHDLVDYICSLVPQFLGHTYIKRHQASEYQTCKERATNNTDPEEALIQVDFSENYTCVNQDEIQSAHWNQRQVSLFTVAAWHSGSQHSHVIASDNLTHGKETVIAYLDKVLDGLPDHMKKVSLWSDGPASQFKNRYIAASLDTLQCKHKLEIQWNFFATSHGKGPVDGIGGSVKHHVWGKVKARKAIVCDAATFAAAVKDMKGVTVTVLTRAQIKARNALLHLDSIFEAARPIRGVASMHCIQSSKTGGISTFMVSADVRSQAQPESEEA